MSRNVVIVAIIVLVLIIGGWFLIAKQSTNTNVQPVQTSVSTQTEQNLVKITASGFSPKDITVKVGESVTWENTDPQSHTVNSDNHPTHLLYPFLNLGVIKPGEKKTV